MIAGEFNVLMSLSPKLSRGMPETPEAGQLYQKRCVQSWLDAGACVISINNSSEIALMESTYNGVLFVQSKDDITQNSPRKLPTLTEMLELGVSLENSSVFAITNSDVSFAGNLTMLKSLFQAAEGRAIISNRHERAPTSMQVGLPYLYGYDFVALDKEYVVPDELNGFVIGSPWWDYLFLFMLASRDVPLSMLASPVIVHSTHTQAWSHEKWRNGLSEVARRIRLLAAEEGPAAALLGFICRNLENGVLPGFSTNEIVTQLGITLGTAMVSYINERCREILWFTASESSNGIFFEDKLNRNVYQAPYVGI